MKSSCILLLFVAANAVDRLEWEAFKVRHGKKYETPSEERNRMKVFFENQRAIEDHNKKFQEGLVSFSMKMNHFGDLTVQEFKSQMNKWKNTTRAAQVLSTFEVNNGTSLPDSVDWRQQGAVTPVKNQLQCGACWAFSATGSLEGQYFRSSGVLVSLSEQQLVDCSSGYGNSCSGGLMNQAFIYLAAAGGIDTEESYPYEGKADSCRFQQSSVVATVKKVFNIPAEEASLQEAVATVGPISVALDAGHQSFQFYSQGIYYESACSSSNVDHGALAVGYGSEDGLDFWSVKNSWGSDWGEAGYIRMSRNKDNNCGIATEASYPQV